MTVLAPFDASDLAATVERARALLDEGDVIAARLIAAAAYDQAKAAGSYAERFGAAERLVGKARQLQGDALLIEARAKMTLADEYDAAQAAGAAARRGRPKKNVADDDVFTAESAGLSRQEIHEARKLRDAERREPGIVARAIQARLDAGLEPTRTAVKRGIGTRSAPADERGLDFYPTPIEAVRALLAIEAFAPTVWEPACGNGAVSRPLEDAGYDVRLTDIADRGLADRHGECQEVADFLVSTPDGVTRDIVTNPPFGLVNAFIAHALRAHRPRKMAMLLNLNAMCGADNGDRIFWMEEWPPARILVFSRRLPMMHRDGWDGERAGSQMNTAWFIWEATGLQEYPYGRETRLIRVDWKKLVDAPALPPVAPPRRNEIADALIAAEAAKAVARRAGKRTPQQEHTS